MKKLKKPKELLEAQRQMIPALELFREDKEAKYRQSYVGLPDGEYLYLSKPEINQ